MPWVTSSMSRTESLLPIPGLLARGLQQTMLKEAVPGVGQQVVGGASLREFLLTDVLPVGWDRRVAGKPDRVAAGRTCEQGAHPESGFDTTDRPEKSPDMRPAAESGPCRVGS